MDEFHFNYNFDNLDLVLLHKEDGITREEMIYVFEKPSHRVIQEGGPELTDIVHIQTEYTPKRRIIRVAYVSDGETVFFLGAKIADEEEVNKYYCGF
ncbi:hypothetical protein [Arsenicibacter rosenii]|uniref:Uncharacterized protein n=1 Tax=Arsenicibacter rosenii TaxID=1750698 RepID=A0A1S2VIZ0_9BACT|nr:hypothetical protein [Arsenicibacter rosenii]OIN58186.1 hypothetical protein BLX24_16870 [Arsenicibacter rosenii]